MADSKFRINVVAVDKATAIIRNIKGEFKGVTAPIRDLQSVFGSIGKETGLADIGKSILDIGAVTSSVASKMAAMPSLIGGGLSIAEIAAEIGRFAQLGGEIHKTSSIIGVSTDNLQRLRGAARLVNVDSSTLDGGLKSLGTTMEDVFFHRAAPETIAVMNQMGIGFKKTAQGAPDIVDGISNVADAVRKLNGNPYAQQKLLQSLGLSDDLLPFLERGAAGIRQLLEEYQKTGGMIKDADIERANKLEVSFVRLGDAIGGVTMRLAGLLDEKTGMTDFNNAMADWIGGDGPNPLSAVAKVVVPKLIGNPLTSNISVPLLTTALVADEVENYFSGTADVKNSTPGRSASAPIILNTGRPSSASSSFVSVDIPSSQIVNGASASVDKIPLPPTPDQIQSRLGSDGISIDGPAPSPRAIEDAAIAVVPKVSIELLLKNAPPGMQVQARDANGTNIPARVEYGMPVSGP